MSASKHKRFIMCVYNIFVSTLHSLCKYILFNSIVFLKMWMCLLDSMTIKVLQLQTDSQENEHPGLDSAHLLMQTYTQTLQNLGCMDLLCPWHTTSKV